jgi:hypothetical protein
MEADTGNILSSPRTTGKNVRQIRFFTLLSGNRGRTIGRIEKKFKS